MALADLAEEQPSERCAFLRRSIASSKGALTVYVAVRFPRNHADTLHNLEIDRKTYEAAGCADEVPFDAIAPAN